MKRLIGFSLFIIITFGVFLYVANRKRNYELTYEVDGYQISERYSVDDNNYFFKAVSPDGEYNFVMAHDYSKKRKIVNKVNVINNEGAKCVNLNFFKDSLTPYICLIDGEYYDAYKLGLQEEAGYSEIANTSQIGIYNKDYQYYIWNGYGLTDLLKNKEYKFLKNEVYDNTLAYQLDNYLLIADYDDTREFSKIYLFDSKANKISEINFDNRISFNSYFMGDYKGLVYLIDRKNKIQYAINPEKKSIAITSDENGAFYYDDKEDEIGVNKLVYNDIYFKKTHLVNYELDNNNLYYHFININDKILISDEVTGGLIRQNNDTLFYIDEDTLYKYDLYKGRVVLLKYFEWNFSFKNKIFIFD